VKRFKLVLKNGRCISIPYSSLPIIDYNPQGKIVISGHNYIISITGRNLINLFSWLTDECLISLTASRTGIDVMEEDQIYVDDITVKGKAFEAPPQPE